ncbi:MAG: hypothetical protein JEY97_10060 [Bacteroidales bacterium]|nr:hypothetical protein [Bacteroidales bacterium]
MLAFSIDYKCEKGSQLRPHIVWFGEAVPVIMDAIQIAKKADIFIVIETSMVVYPTAGLINYISDETPKYFIDPNAEEVSGIKNLTIIRKKVGEGVPDLVEELLRLGKSQM